MKYPVITRTQAQQIVAGQEKISLDLGITEEKITIKDAFVTLKKEKVELIKLKNLKEGLCYVIINNQVIPITSFSEQSNYYYKLLPTTDWPTITFSSTPMHRHTRMSPKQSAQQMVDEISPVQGTVLDTCCGLGYTAILAAKKAKHIYTFEIDPTVQEIAQFNPYSEELYNNNKITLTMEDVFEAITKFPNQHFDRILHDPPTFKYAENLYDQSFHKELYRVLKKGGILYHYCPNPKKLKGTMFHPRIVRQLKRAGFTLAIYKPESSGIKAVKEF